MVHREKDPKTYTTKSQKIDTVLPDSLLTDEWRNYRAVYEQAEKGKEFDYPIHVEIEDIYACTLRCIHCARQYLDKTSTRKMDDDLYKKIIQEAAAIGTRAVGYAIWGEVFLDTTIFEKIAFAKSHGILDIRLHSNGLLITEKIAEKIIESGVTFLSISLDAATPETYSKTRGGDFHKAIAGLANVISQKLRSFSLLPKLRVSLVKSSINEHEAGYFADYFSQYCDVAIQEFWDPWNILPDGLKPKTLEYVRKKQCFDNYFKVFIRHDGKVVPCCEDVRSHIILGDLKKTSLYDIYNGTVAKDLRNQHRTMNIRNKTCRTCLRLDQPTETIAGLTGRDAE
jgi:radical SAM protein with 4Fe4S-binding SPASM domain